MNFLEELKACTACKLHTTRKQVVVGDGNLGGRVLAIGEGPGADEDEKGLPFVGQSGSLLRTSLQLQGFPMGDLYITNTVRCRPPNNRNPEADEIAACEKWTKLFIAHMNPIIVVPVGKFATHSVGNYYKHPLLQGASITKVAGKIYKADHVQIYPILHPSYIMRTGGYELFQEQIRGLVKVYQDTITALGQLEDLRVRLQYPGGASPEQPSSPGTPACKLPASDAASPDSLSPNRR